MAWDWFDSLNVIMLEEVRQNHGYYTMAPNKILAAENKIACGLEE